MKSSKYLIIVIGLMLTSLIFAASESSVKAEKAKTEPVLVQMVVEDFEDGNITSNPEWWVFDKVLLSFGPEKGYGENTIIVKGKASDWYVGGFGTYVAREAVEYDTFTMDIYGKGPGSGKIKVQLFDDDNNTDQLEQDDSFNPLGDDRFEKEIDIKWVGWKKVEIPLKDFKDTNVGIGDDKWNPGLIDGSAGLLHVQLVFIAGKKDGSIDMKLDNIALTKKN